MNGQYLAISAKLGKTLSEVQIKAIFYTRSMKVTKMEFPLYIGGKALVSNIPRILELGGDAIQGIENLSQMLVYMKGERGRAGSASGTNNPYKKLKPDPDKPGWVKEQNANGGTTSKVAPPGFKEYWNNKHPDQRI